MPLSVALLRLCVTLCVFFKGSAAIAWLCGGLCGSRVAATVKVAVQESSLLVGVLGYSAVSGLYRGCVWLPWSGVCVVLTWWSYSLVVRVV